MPKKPQIDHPVRQVRTCLGHTQASFAKLVGCSAIAIQRVENGSLPLSDKLAYAIAEATGANHNSLQGGTHKQALDWMGSPYSEASLRLAKEILPVTEKEIQYQLHTHFRFLELLLIASERGGKRKIHAVIAAIQKSFEKIAHDFNLETSITRFLVEKGSVAKRKYRVADLRQFPEYAHLLGFKDNKRFKADKLVEFVIPKGWIEKYWLIESPVLPHGADRKLRDANYILDMDCPIPQAVKEAIAEALYWKIESFTPLP